MLLVALLLSVLLHGTAIAPASTPTPYDTIGGPIKTCPPEGCPIP